MEILTYNPSSHASQGYIWEDASAFTVWAAAWNSTFLASSDKAIVPCVRMAATERRRAADSVTSDAALTVETAFEAELNDSFAALRAVPYSRRVLFPTYLQDDGIGGNDLDNFNTTKNYALTKIVIDGANWDSPFQYKAATNSQTRQARDLFKRYVNACEQNNAHFSYILDDMESWLAWDLGSVRNTTGSVQAWESPGDARMIKTIVNDSRFNDLAHGDILRGITWQSLLESNYLSLNGSAASTATIMAPWLAITTAGGYITPWATPNAFWSWRNMLRQITETHRVEHIMQYAMNKDWFVGTYANYDMMNCPFSEWQFLKDYNGHKVFGGLGHTHEKYTTSPVLYGQVDGLTGGGFTTTPTTPDHNYTVKSAGAGVTAYASDAYLAFILDMQKIRAVIRSNLKKTFSPWVRPPDHTTDSCVYYQDERYWYEMMYHAALSGARPFHYFNTDAHTGCGNVLREIKEITKNGVLWPCSNTMCDPDVLSDRLILQGTGNAGGVFTTAKICSGPLKNRYITRVTSSPTPIGGTGGTRLSLLGESSLTVDIPSTSRGAWLIHGNTVPTLFAASGI